MFNSLKYSHIRPIPPIIPNPPIDSPLRIKKLSCPTSPASAPVVPIFVLGKNKHTHKDHES